MKLSSIPQIIDFDPFQVRTEDEATHGLGEAIVLSDFRVFRFGQGGANSYAAGKLKIAPAPIANHANMVTGTAALGATSVSVTPGATAGNADIYQEGYLVINDATGEGRSYKVKGHLAISASTAFTVDLFDPISGVALVAATSEASLVHNTYKLCLEGTTSNIRAAGVPLVASSSGDFLWFLTKGVAAVLCDTATTLGAPQIVGAVAGSVKDQTDILGASSEKTVAWADIMAGVDTEYRPVSMCLD